MSPWVGTGGERAERKEGPGILLILVVWGRSELLQGEIFSRATKSY